MNSKKLKNRKRINIAIAMSILGVATSTSVGIAFPLANNLKIDTQIKVSKNNIFKDKNNFNNFDQKMPTKQSALPDGKIDPSQLATLSNHTQIPPAIEGIKREFSIKTNKENGIATVTIAFSSKYGHKENTSYQIRNFKTNLDHANEKIGQLIISDIENKPSKKEKTIVEYNLEPNKEHFQHPTHDEFSFEFISATPIDTNGETKVTYQVDVVPQIAGTKPKQLTFIVDGFQTQLAYAQVQIDNLVKDKISNPTRKQQVGYKSTPTTDDLNLPQAKGFIFQFISATPVDPSGTSQARYQVNVDPQIAGTKPKQLTFDVKGFQTEKKYATELISNLDEKDIIPPTKKQEVSYRHRPTSDDLNPPQATGFIFEFEEADPVNTNGKANVSYITEYKVGNDYSARKIFHFDVKNFQTKKEYFDSLVEKMEQNFEHGGTEEARFRADGRISDPLLLDSTPEEVIQNLKDPSSFKRYTNRDWLDIFENPNDLEISTTKFFKDSVLINIKIKERPKEVFQFGLINLKES